MDTYENSADVAAALAKILDGLTEVQQEMTLRPGRELIDAGDSLRGDLTALIGELLMEAGCSAADSISALAILNRPGNYAAILLVATSYIVPLVPI